MTVFFKKLPIFEHLKPCPSNLKNEKFSFWAQFQWQVKQPLFDEFYQKLELNIFFQPEDIGVPRFQL